MVVIYGINKHLNPIKRELSEAIHACMQSVLGMPEKKRAHRIVPLDESDFFYPGGRTEAYTVIEINMMKGRTPETQKALIKALFKTISSTVGISPVDIEQFSSDRSGLKSMRDQSETEDSIRPTAVT